MKKGIATLLTLTLTAGAVTGCGGSTTATAEPASTEQESSQDASTDVAQEKLNIVTTIFPVFDWTREILGDDIENVNLQMLIDSGVDLHSFQPTVEDIVTIENCDVFIYVGGHSDTWAEEVIAASNNTDMKIINLVEVLGDAVKMEEHVEGMQSGGHDHDEDEHDHDHDEEEHDHDHDEDEHDHDHDEDEHDHDHDDEEHDHDHDEEEEEHDHDHDEEEHDHDHDEDEHDHDHDEDEHDHDHDEEEHDHDHDEDEHDHDEEGHAHSHEDEHIWLSLKNAMIICEAIANELTALNSDGNYIENAQNYIESLSSLDAEYETVVDASEINTLLFADRFPFRYLVDDYGIDYYAAFSGCSAETEASFETITFLSQKSDELDLEEIIIIDGSDSKIAETVNSNSANDQEVIVMNSMQSTTATDVANGATYLDIMKQNLDVLGIALD